MRKLGRLAFGTTLALSVTTVLGAQVRYANFGDRFKQRDSRTPWTQYDKTGSAAHIEKLEADSPDRPDSGLTLDSNLEQLSKDEVAGMITTLSSSYNPAMYGMTVFPSVDIVFFMMKHALLPKQSPELLIARFLGDPVVCFRNPSKVENVMGETRFRILCKVLDQEVEDYNNSASPMCRSLKKLGLPQDVWVPFLRGLVTEGMLGKDNLTQLPTLVLGLARGAGPSSLGLDNDADVRVRQVGALLVAAACEYGRVVLADLAIQLLKANGVQPSREMQKQLTFVLSRSASRELDWKVRTSGVLQQRAPKWLSSYRKKVDVDVSAGISELLDLESMEEDGFDDAPKKRRSGSHAEDQDEVEGDQDGAPVDSFKSLFTNVSGSDEVSQYFAEGQGSTGKEFHGVYLKSLKRTLTSKRNESTVVKADDAKTGTKPKRVRSKSPLTRREATGAESQQRLLREAMEALSL